MYNHLFISDVSKLTRGSGIMVQLECSLQTSEKCEKIITQPYRWALQTIQRNDGNYICQHCYRTTKRTGRNNPNKKYNLDDDMFKSLDPEKAYLLGWIASDGGIEIDKIRIHIHEKDIECLKILGNIVCDNYKITHTKDRPMIKLQISSKTISKDVCDLLQIEPKKKSDVVKFPIIDDDELKWAFLRGLVEGDGHISNIDKESSPHCSIASNSSDMLESIKEFTKIPCKINKNTITFSGLNCIDFLGKIYENCDKYILQRKYNMYQRWIESGWQPRIVGKENHIKLKNCFAYKTHVDAVIPYKSRDSDVGFDLTIIKESKVFNDVTTLYDTGIKLSIPLGYYVEIVARSSLSKSGYILGNSVGILDNSYRGPVYVPLTKISPNAEPIQLPFRCCQMIIKKQEYIKVIGTCEEPDETSRNEGGFGSTNK